MVSLDTLTHLYIYINELNGALMLTMRLACACDFRELDIPKAEVEREGDGWVITVIEEKDGEAA